ncbi:MAG: hypothetical protein JO186_07555 [Actinobacteria bacterium]|nr:hypothetical protein [Actinomycetota bacterium]MBV8395567.1 hypothetical protein [Actinomycetota bacterium]MBV8599207.1 hypothetical protein [Actinomycetota bacterium]
METHFAPFTEVPEPAVPASDEQTEALLADLDRAAQTLGMFRGELNRLAIERDRARDDAARQREAMSTVRAKLLEVAESIAENR